MLNYTEKHLNVILADSDLFSLKFWTFVNTVKTVFFWHENVKWGRVWSNGVTFWQRKLEIPVSYLSQGRFVHQISHVKWPGIEPSPPRWNDVLNNDLAVWQMLITSEVEKKAWNCPHQEWEQPSNPVLELSLRGTRTWNKICGRLSWGVLLFPPYLSSVTICFFSPLSIFTSIDFVTNANLSS